MLGIIPGPRKRDIAPFLKVLLVPELQQLHQGKRRCISLCVSLNLAHARALRTNVSLAPAFRCRVAHSTIVATLFWRTRLDQELPISSVAWWRDGRFACSTCHRRTHESTVEAPLRSLFSLSARPIHRTPRRADNYNRCSCNDNYHHYHHHHHYYYDRGSGHGGSGHGGGCYDDDHDDHEEEKEATTQYVVEQAIPLIQLWFCVSPA